MSTLKKETIEKSAKSIAKYFETVSGSDLLALYNSVAPNGGITAKEYLDDYYTREYLTMCEFPIHSSRDDYRTTIVEQMDLSIRSIDFASNFIICTANEENFQSMAA